MKTSVHLHGVEVMGKELGYYLCVTVRDFSEILSLIGREVKLCELWDGIGDKI